MNIRLVIRIVLVGLLCAAAFVQPAIAAAAEGTEKKPSVTSSEVILETIYPTTVYPDPSGKRYNFEIVGRNLGKEANANVVDVIGKGPQIMAIANCGDKQPQQDEKPCLVVPKGMEGRKLNILGFQPDPYKGPLEMRVRVVDNTGKENISNALKATFAAYSQKTVFLMAFVVFAAIAFIIVRVLLWNGVGYHEIDGVKYGPLRSFLLDKQTDTYSLSKFQLVAWTSVAVFSYLYLFLCRVLIQWKYEWPDIPEGLPLLLGLSVGTTVLSHGVTTSFGSKGAGAVRPSPADFISSGGMVMGERFQFFVWTIIGCLGFLFLLMRVDPATLSELPKVPDNFLYLMGISAAGYLGGKAVRKAGPVIKSVSIAQIAENGASLSKEYEPPSTVKKEELKTVLTLMLKGENLDEKAKIKIDDKPIDRADQFWIHGLPDPQSKLCCDLYVSLNVKSIDETNQKPLLEGEHTLTLVNGEGQAADVRFPVDPMSIDSVDKLPAGTVPVTIKVTGKNFGEKIEVEWVNAAGQYQGPKSTSPTAAKRKSATELEVNLIPGPKGEKKGKLTLISEAKLKASKEVDLS